MKKYFVLFAVICAFCIAVPYVNAQSVNADASAGASSTTINNNTDYNYDYNHDYNYDYNNNSDYNSQGQGQDQGQHQDQKQKQGMALEDVGNIKDSFNSTTRRPFAIPGDVNFAPLPSYFGPSNPGQQFIPLQFLTAYKTEWEIDWAENMLTSSRFGRDVEIRVLIPADENNLPKVIEVTGSKGPEGEFKKVRANEGEKLILVGYGTIAATTKGNISADVFAEALVQARDAGANVIQFLAEGVNSKMTSFGWGVGLNFTRSSISDDQDVGTVGSGGFGISGGEAGYHHEPWQQFVLLKRAPIN